MPFTSSGIFVSTPKYSSDPYLHGKTTTYMLSLYAICIFFWIFTAGAGVGGITPHLNSAMSTHPRGTLGAGRGGWGAALWRQRHSGVSRCSARGARHSAGSLVGVEETDIRIRRETTTLNPPELASDRAAEDDVGRRLFQVAADWAHRLGEGEDVLLEKRGPWQDPVLDQEPAEESHLGWRRVLPDKVGKRSNDAAETAKTIQGTRIQPAIWRKSSQTMFYMLQFMQT